MDLLTARRKVFGPLTPWPADRSQKDRVLLYPRREPVALEPETTPPRSGNWPRNLPSRRHAPNLPLRQAGPPPDFCRSDFVVLKHGDIIEDIYKGSSGASRGDENRHNTL